MARPKPDLEIKLMGKRPTGSGLDADDLQALSYLLQGLSSYDPSLKSIHIFGSIKKGSTCVSAVAPTEIGFVGVNPARSALRNFFEKPFDPKLGWLWNKSARASLENIAKREQVLAAKVMPAQEGDLPLSTKFTKDDYESFSKKIAEEPEWRTIYGKILEIDIKDRSFEIHTADGRITCKFPEDSSGEKLLSLVKKVVSADVLCRSKPNRGSWKAYGCAKVVLAPEQGVILYPPLTEDELNSKLAEFDTMFKPSKEFAADYVKGMRERYGT